MNIDNKMFRRLEDAARSLYEATIGAHGSGEPIPKSAAQLDAMAKYEKWAKDWYGEKNEKPD